MSDEIMTAGTTPEPGITEEMVLDVLRDVYDPEIQMVNIVELGLIYTIEMTMTAIGCPAAGEIMQDVEDHILTLPGITSCHIELSFDPMWTPDRMTEDAKWELGLV
jgi:metal-sulfur cluster biosynthetic enzyme